jgi:hypothetical protein
MILAPQNPYACTDITPLIPHLQQVGLCAEPITPGQLPDDWYALALGECFFEWFAFTGCAVQLPTATSQPECHLQIRPTAEQPIFFSGSQTRPPQCPACRQVHVNWRDQLSAWQPSDANFALSCPKCHHQAPGWDWHWKRRAGFGCAVLSLEPVFTGEVAPLPAILKLLSSLTNGASWDWFEAQ